MILKVFSVYDVKARAFAQPFFFSEKGEAIRAFMSAVNDKNTMFNRYPEDYMLYYVGMYDNSSAIFDSVNPIEMLGTAKEFKEEQPPVRVVPSVEVEAPKEISNA